jgi:hypothetical protein
LRASLIICPSSKMDSVVNSVYVLSEGFKAR